MPEQKELMLMPRLLFERFYPAGMPLHFQNKQWQGNTKDDLVKAIHHHYDITLEKRTDPLSEYELQLIQEFCIYFIEAPCWVFNCAVVFEKEYQQCVRLAHEIKDRETIYQFTEACMDIGLDPF